MTSEQKGKFEEAELKEIALKVAKGRLDRSLKRTKFALPGKI